MNNNTKKNKPMIGEAGVIYTDGAYNNTTSPFGWSSVVDSWGQDLIPRFMELSKHDSDNNNNNNGEKKNINTVKIPLHQQDSFTIEEKSLHVENKAIKRHVAICKFDDVKVQQNNGAELIALVIGLRLAIVDSTIKKVYTDSQLLQQWWSKGHVNSKTWKDMDPIKQKYITECKFLREAFEKNGGCIEHISGDYNLADLGYHKKK